MFQDTNKLQGLRVGTILADLCGGLCKDNTWDSNKEFFDFTYTPYKIVGFDLDDYGNVSQILCNRCIISDPDDVKKNRVFDLGITRFPVSYYKERLFVESSSDLYNKIRQVHDTAKLRYKILSKDTEPEIEPNTSYVEYVKVNLKESSRREVYILDVVRYFFDSEDYVRFTLYDSVGESKRKFRGPYLLSVSKFKEIILNRFLKEADWMPRDMDFGEYESNEQ